MAIKVTKGQIRDGTISCYKEYYSCGKFHSFMKSAQYCRFWGAMPLYYNVTGCINLWNIVGNLSIYTSDHNLPRVCTK